MELLDRSVHAELATYLTTIEIHPTGILNARRNRVEAGMQAVLYQVFGSSPRSRAGLHPHGTPTPLFDPETQL